MDKLRRFMYGRYGADKLGYALIIFWLIVSIIAGAVDNFWVRMLSYLPVLWAIFRMFSKNVQARRKENAVFLKFYAPIEKWFKLQANRFRDRKTHRYYSCPSCHNTLRVPKGKGEITITCPVCKTKFDKKT
ncbi:MAG: hypothetical protein HFE63_02390 [Clostridiales bacterium]|nr:hypothetical protein [Clostridiales bacterium]